MSKILVIGGAGTIGGAFARSALEEPSASVCVFSRSELNHDNFLRTFDSEDAKRLGFYPGDVKDIDAIRKCVKALNPDVIVLTAAMKRIEVCEHNPVEALMVNAVGVENVCRVASESNSVRSVLFTSTDKASDPVGVYGNTKAIAEVIMKKYAKQFPEKRFVTTRFANVLMSNGSVIPIFKSLIEKGKPLTVRANDMTRFFLTPNQACQVMWDALSGAYSDSGDILVPECRSMKIAELAEVMIKKYGNEKSYVNITAPLPFEKLHEVLVSKSGLTHVKERKDGYFILDLEHQTKHLYPEYSSGNTLSLVSKKDISDLLDVL